MPRELSFEEDAFAIEWGRSLIIYLTNLGFSLELIKERIETSRQASPLNIARIISGESPYPIYNVIGGATPEIRWEGVRASVQRYYEWVDRRTVKHISSIILGVARNHQDVEIRVAILAAFPKLTPAKYFRSILFSNDGGWRRKQRGAVRRAVILELARRGYHRFLVEMAQDPQLPSKYCFLILRTIRQEELVYLARHAEAWLARLAMKRISSPDTLQKLSDCPRRAVRSEARRKLGLPPVRPRRPPGSRS